MNQGGAAGRWATRQEDTARARHLTIVIQDLGERLRGHLTLRRDAQFFLELCAGRSRGKAEGKEGSGTFALKSSQAR